MVVFVKKKTFLVLFVKMVVFVSGGGRGVWQGPHHKDSAPHRAVPGPGQCAQCSLQCRQNPSHHRPPH